MRVASVDVDRPAAKKGYNFSDEVAVGRIVQFVPMTARTLLGGSSRWHIACDTIVAPIVKE